jgi:hypothetical protein
MSEIVCTVKSLRGEIGRVRPVKYPNSVRAFMRIFRLRKI